MAGMASAGVQLWSSPIPYIFGGIAAVVLLIAIALAILACTNRKSSAGAATGGSTSLPAVSTERPAIIGPLEMEPMIVVVMAGNDKPSFLAKHAEMDVRIESLKISRD